MHNWFSNLLTVTGKAIDVDKWKGLHCKNNKLNFDVAVPITTDGPWDAYDLWGTRAVCDEEFNWRVDGKGNFELTIHFETAWEPPQNISRDNPPVLLNGWLRSCAEQHPELDFEMEFTEPNEGFRGEFKFKNGIVEKMDRRSNDRLTADDKFILGYEDEDEDEPERCECEQPECIECTSRKEIQDEIA